jgi:hypothetical protein
LTKLVRTLRPRTVPPAPRLAELPPLLARIYAARGVTGPEELNLGARALLPPGQLHGVDAAARRLEQAQLRETSVSSSLVISMPTARRARRSGWMCCVAAARPTSIILSPIALSTAMA